MISCLNEKVSKCTHQTLHQHRNSCQKTIEVKILWFFFFNYTQKNVLLLVHVEPQSYPASVEYFGPIMSFISSYLLILFYIFSFSPPLPETFRELQTEFDRREELRRGWWRPLATNKPEARVANNNRANRGVNSCAESWCRNMVLNSGAELCC